MTLQSPLQTKKQIKNMLLMCVGFDREGKMVQNDEAEYPDAPTDQEALKFVWTISELKEDLEYWSNNYIVEVTLTRQNPTVWMKFVKGEDGCKD